MLDSVDYGCISMVMKALGVPIHTMAKPSPVLSAEPEPAIDVDGDAHFYSIQTFSYLGCRFRKRGICEERSYRCNRFGMLIILSVYILS